MEQGQLIGTVTNVTFKGMQYDIIVDFRGFKWLIQTTDHSPVGARIGVKIDQRLPHYEKSEYSGMFGDYSSYSEEYEELADAAWSWKRRRARMKTKLSHFAIPYGGVDGHFVVAPIIIMGRLCLLRRSGRGYAGQLRADGRLRAVFGRSFKLAIIATAICLLMGYPIAYIIARAPRARRKRSSRSS